MKKLFMILITALCYLNIHAQKDHTIYENFKNNDRKWLIENVEDGESRIKKGVYSIANKSDKVSRGYFTDFIIDPNQDYTIISKLIAISGERNLGYGLVWGFESWETYVCFLVNGNGQMCIYGYKNKEFFWVLEWTSVGKAVINNNRLPNILKIEKKDDEIKYFVNDKQVHSSENILIAGTKLGFMLDGRLALAADYLYVTIPEKPINLIHHPINGFVLENLGSNINSEFCEKGQLISADGQTLYFTRANPDTTKYDEIFYSIKDENGNWMPSVDFGSPFNNEGFNSLLSMTPDGNTALLVNVYQEDGSAMEESGVSISYKRDGVWSIPVKVEIDNYKNENKFENFCLSADGTKLLMALENDSSLGGQDLFVSFIKEDETWGIPQNMGGNINTFSSEFSPFIAADGKTLFFASFGLPGYGSSDIFMAKRLDDTWLNWSEPKNLGPEINSDGWDAYYQTSALGDYAYLVSTEAGLSLGSCDLFRIPVSESMMADPVIIVVGKVINGKTNEVLNAGVFYENLISGKEEGSAFSGKDEGFKIVLPLGGKYGFRAQLDGFIAISQNVDLTELDAYEERKVDLILIPIEKGQTIRLNNLFFDIGKSTIKVESFSELDRLVEVMEKNSDIKIKITGHTDNSGSNDINLKLSTNRARAVKNYLVEKGINKKRISYKGFGSSQPVESNDTPEGRLINRRVEFIIL